MKKKIVMLISIGCLLFAGITEITAQEYMKTDPSTVKVLSDTTYMTAMMVTFPPGYTTKFHTHPAHFVYAMNDGTLSIEYADGKKMDFALKAGESFSAPPEGPHRTTNSGQMPLSYILVEFKEHPYKTTSSKKMK